VLCAVAQIKQNVAYTYFIETSILKWESCSRSDLN
jgi:hypothetical protein